MATASPPTPSSPRPVDPRHGRASRRPFALVLAGGGARGAAHIGVLRALEHRGHAPGAIVGVSMGAIVGATYALNPSWYRALTDLDLARIPGLTVAEPPGGLRTGMRTLLASSRALRHLLLRWGTLAPAEEAIRATLRELTLDLPLEAGRIPVAVVATDLVAGERVVLGEGNAADVVYGSAALAGILPPLRHDAALLADGAYADVAPIDVARRLGGEVVVAVNASPRSPAAPPRNGVQALMRSLEISHYQYALERFAAADLVLAPAFPLAITTLDFRHHRRCVAAGVRSVRARARDIDALLGPGRRAGARLRAHERPAQV
jgi:NTE family protein